MSSLPPYATTRSTMPSLPPIKMPQDPQPQYWQTQNSTSDAIAAAISAVEQRDEWRPSSIAANLEKDRAKQRKQIKEMKEQYDALLAIRPKDWWESNEAKALFAKIEMAEDRLDQPTSLNIGRWSGGRIKRTKRRPSRSRSKLSRSKLSKKKRSKKSKNKSKKKRKKTRRRRR
jgi:hypothetical protein